MSGTDMKRFWDERAGEDPWFFIDDRLQYGGADVERFFAEGRGVLDAVLERVGSKVGPDDDVVEIGCGAGRLTRPLAEDARSVVAIDVSERMIELAHEHNPQLENVEWLVGDGESLAGVADASADVVFSHVVFQHIPDPEVTLGYIREMGRVLRPGGWAAFQVSNDPCVHRRRKRGLRDRLSRLLGRGPKGQDSPQWLGSAVEVADVERAAADGGLRVERVDGAGTQFCFVLLRRG